MKGFSIPNNSLDCWEKDVRSLSDGPPGHLKNPMRGFFKLFLRFFVNRGVSLAAASDEGSALRPAIFREKLSKAFFVLGRGSTQIRAFRWDVSITQEHSFRRNASPTSAPAGPGRPVPPAGIPPPADRRKYSPAHAVPVLRPLPPPYRAARWSRAPSPFGSPSFSAPFS